MRQKKMSFYERHPALTGWLITGTFVAVCLAAFALAAN